MSTKNKVDLCIAELRKINSILEKFDNVTYITINSESVSGIGKLTSIKFNYTVNGIDCMLETEITGVDDW